MTNDINKAVDTLNKRGNSLFMACQLNDFFAFLSLGGICPKSNLEQSHLSFTNYETDICLKKMTAGIHTFFISLIMVSCSIEKPYIRPIHLVRFCFISSQIS